MSQFYPKIGVVVVNHRNLLSCAVIFLGCGVAFCDRKSVTLRLIADPRRCVWPRSQSQHRTATYKRWQLWELYGFRRKPYDPATQ
jgi:hypothetical protein